MKLSSVCRGSYSSRAPWFFILLRRDYTPEGYQIQGLRGGGIPSGRETDLLSQAGKAWIRAQLGEFRIEHVKGKKRLTLGVHLPEAFERMVLVAEACVDRRQTTVWNGCSAPT